MKFLHDSAWLCMEKLKKHSFETKQFQKILEIPNKSQKNVIMKNTKQNMLLNDDAFN